MRYQRKVQICVDGVWRTHDLVFEYWVKREPISLPGQPVQLRDFPIVTKTVTKYPTWEADKSWFWDVCPSEVSEKIDRELLEYAAEEGQVAS